MMVRRHVAVSDRSPEAQDLISTHAPESATVRVQIYSRSWCRGTEPLRAQVLHTRRASPLPQPLHRTGLVKSLGWWQMRLSMFVLCGSLFN